MGDKSSNTAFFSQIVKLLQSARNKVVRTINQKMVATYFEIGKMIVEKEQHGEERAAYGKNLLGDLSKVLTKEFGKGFSATNLKQMRQFYLVYSIGQTLSDDSINISQGKSINLENPFRNFELSWSHYLKLMRINDINERKFYEIKTNQVKVIWA